MNRWNIPDWLEKEIRERDTQCVYCGLKFENSSTLRKYKATWEHIINDAKIVNRENIALCCFSCNSSKGAKELSQWLLSDYCKRKNITRLNVANVIKQRLNASQ